MTAPRRASSTGPSSARKSIDDLLVAARTALQMELAFLSHIEDGQQEFRYVTATAGPLQLDAGARVADSESYCSFMLSGDVGHAVGDVRAHPVLGALAVTEELGIGAYCGVPVRLPDGTLYGTLCGLSGETRDDLSSDQVTVLSVISSLLGQQLEAVQQEELATASERQRLLSLLAPGRLSVVVQPIVDVVAGGPVGFEALARFDKGAAEPRRPDEVFATASRLGLSVDVEVAALRAAAPLAREVPDDVYLSVNLSAPVLCAPAAREALRTAPLDRLVLELTEHDAVEDYEEISGVLSDLRLEGLRLAIDDVGAGYSSLRHILRLDPDVIKLDMALTRGVDGDPARRALVASFVSFARETGTSLVAEGVETAEERAALEGLGVRLMQGYLLGRPAPLPATEQPVKRSPR